MEEKNLYKGAVKQSKAAIKWARARRPHIDRHVAKVSIPFDWTKTVDNTIGVKIKNQGQSSSCGGQAGAYFLGTNLKQEISAKSIYAPFVYPGGGMTSSGIERQICERGANLELAVPSYKPDGTTDESWMTNLSYKNKTIDIDALVRSGWAMVTVPRNADSIAQAIRDYGGVIWMIGGQDGNIPSWISSTPSVPSKTNPNPIWRHFMDAAGAYMKNGEKTIKAFQSWGTNVGNNGTQEFTNEYLQSKYIYDCFTFVRTSSLTQQKTNILNAMIAWLKMMLS